MKTTVLTLLALTVIAAGVSAQVWMDPFTYPDGPLASVGGWNAVAGAWTVKNNIAVAEDKFLWQYANQPNRTFQDGVAQCLVAHNGGATNTLQFGGVALRCVGTSDTVMVKVQNNSSATNPTSFDSIWLYEQPGSAATKTGITPTFPRALVRLALLGQRAEAFVDSDLDGKWDHVVSTTLTGTPKVAPVGIDGFGGVQIDDFEIFDAVILGDTANPRPTPGSTLKYVLRGKSGAGYQAATSLSNSGIVLPDGRIHPADPGHDLHGFRDRRAAHGVLQLRQLAGHQWRRLGQARRAACYLSGRNHLVYRVHHVRRQRHSPGQQRPPGNHRAVADPSVGGTIPLPPRGQGAKSGQRCVEGRGAGIEWSGSVPEPRPDVFLAVPPETRDHTHHTTTRRIAESGCQDSFPRRKPDSPARTPRPTIEGYFHDVNRVIHNRRFHTKRHRLTRTGSLTSESNFDPRPAQRHFPPSCTPPRPSLARPPPGTPRFPG